MGDNGRETETNISLRKPSCSKLEKLQQGMKCCFCGSDENDPVSYGSFYQCEEIVCHYFCLLLSSCMEQKGEDDEGILGFLPADINAELKRGKRLKCKFCFKNGATLGCDKKTCKMVFHLPCGRRNSSLHQFFEQFKSFCSKHRPLQKIDSKVLKEVSALQNGMNCSICYDAVETRVSDNTLWAPCCRKSAWFHRRCVQSLALSSGYFFKCPLCNNKDIFCEEMKIFGIYIPEQDASWEQVPNAYHELLYSHNHCDAPICKCLKGREFKNSGSWRLLRCNSCGSQGTHIGCGNLKNSAADDSWQCSLCTEMLTKSEVDLRSSLKIEGIRSSLDQEDAEDRASVSSSASGRSLSLSVGSESPPPGTLSGVLTSQRRPASAISPAHQPQERKRRKPGPKRFFPALSDDIATTSSAVVGNGHVEIKKEDQSQSSSVLYLGSTSKQSQEPLKPQNDVPKCSKPPPRNKPGGLEEDVVVLSVDSSDDEIQVVDVVQLKDRKSEGKGCTGMLVTNEGTKIQVHHVPSEDLISDKRELGGVMVGNQDLTKQSTGTITNSPSQRRLDHVSVFPMSRPPPQSSESSVVIPNLREVQITPVKCTQPARQSVQQHLSLPIKQESSEAVPQGNLVHNSSETSPMRSLSVKDEVREGSIITESPSSPLCIKIEDVRHSNELFSSNSAMELSMQIQPELIERRTEDEILPMQTARHVLPGFQNPQVASSAHMDGQNGQLPLQNIPITGPQIPIAFPAQGLYYWPYMTPGCGLSGNEVHCATTIPSAAAGNSATATTTTTSTPTATTFAKRTTPAACAQSGKKKGTNACSRSRSAGLSEPPPLQPLRSRNGPLESSRLMEKPCPRRFKRAYCDEPSPDGFLFKQGNKPCPKRFKKNYVDENELYQQNRHW